MTYKYKKQPTNRQLKVSELIRREIAMIFTTLEVYHPALEGVPLTVIDVKTSVDLKISTVFIHSIKPSVDDELAKFLNFLAPEYKRKLTSKIKLKYIPMIRFIVDKNIDKKISMEKVLQEVSFNDR